MNKKIFYCFLGVLVGGLFLLTSSNLTKNRLIENEYRQLTEDSNIKINKIDSYFSIVENEVKELTSSEETKKILKQPLVSSDEIAKINVDEKSLVVIKEINNYIKRNPNKTFNELQNDPFFQKITVQTIGSDGYIAIESYQKDVTFLDKNNNLIGKKYETIKNNSPELYKKIVEGVDSFDVYGFYNWSESGKKTIRKYLRLTHLGTKTSDGVSLVVIVVAGVDNYKVAEDTVDLQLDSFKENINKKDFNNLFLINPDGYIVYTNDVKAGVGSNLNWEVNQDLFLTKKFIENKDKNKIIFSDAYIDDYNELYPVFLVISPVFDQNKLLGYLVLNKKMNTIFEITESTENLGQSGESYLVSQNKKLLISPLRNNHFDTFVQNINTDNINNCFSGTKNKTRVLINYNNEKIVATNSLISKLPWCLATEIKENEVLNVSFNKEIFISIIIFLFLGLMGILMTIRQDKKQKMICGVGSMPCGHVGQKCLLICRCLRKKPSFKEGSFCRLMFLIRRYLMKVKIKYVMLFSLILVIGYFFLVTSFFKGWKKAAFWNDIPDLIILVALINLFFYAFKLKNEAAKELIRWGSVLFIIDKLIQVFLEEYSNSFGFLPVSFWLPATGVGFVGIFLIFYGFNKEINL